MATRTVKIVKKAGTTDRVGLIELRKVYIPGLMLLLGLIVASGLIALVLILFFPNETREAEERVIPDRITDAIPRHRIHFGMNPDQVKVLYPNMALRMNAHHETIGTFLLDGAKHIVTFNKWLSGEKAYRVRYDKTFKTLSEEEILRHFALYYGRVAYDNCKTASGREGLLCQYHWKADGRKTIELRTRPIIKDGKNHIHAAVIATDTYLASKRRK